MRMTSVKIETIRTLIRDYIIIWNVGPQGRLKTKWMDVLTRTMGQGVPGIIRNTKTEFNG